MKKILFITVLIFVIANAKNSNAQNIGIQGGVNLSNFSVSDNEGKFETQSIPGYNFGLVFEVFKGSFLSFETGAKIAKYGMKRVDKYYDTEYKIISSNIEIPFYFKKYFAISDNINFLGLAGGYAGYGLSGMFYEDGEGTKLTWKSDDEGVKRFDYGAIIGVGLRYGSVQLMANYQIGLKNLTFETDYGTKVNNRVLGITLVYYFK